MRLYKIEVSYRTGDSYRTEDVLTTLEMSWKDIDNAKRALQRIKDHFEWYQFKNDPPYMNRKKVDEPEWHKGEEFEFVIKLMLDNGKEVSFCAPWCGYFERLYGAKILTDDSSLEFKIN